MEICQLFFRPNLKFLIWKLLVCARKLIKVCWERPTFDSRILNNIYLWSAKLGIGSNSSSSRLFCPKYRCSSFSYWINHGKRSIWKNDHRFWPQHNPKDFSRETLKNFWDGSSMAFFMCSMLTEYVKIFYYIKNVSM